MAPKKRKSGRHKKGSRTRVNGYAAPSGWDGRTAAEVRRDKRRDQLAEARARIAAEGAELEVVSEDCDSDVQSSGDEGDRQAPGPATLKEQLNWPDEVLLVLEAAGLLGKARELWQEGNKFQLEVGKVYSFSKPVPATLSSAVSGTVGSSLFGYMPHMRHVGTESMALPTVRYTVEGERSVVAFPFSTALAFCKAAGKPHDNLDAVLGFVGGVAKEAGTTALATLSPEMRASIVSCRVGAESAVYLPAGYILFEAAANNTTCVGLRTALFVPSAAAELKHLHEFLGVHPFAEKMAVYLKCCSDAKPAAAAAAGSAAPAGAAAKAVGPAAPAGAAAKAAAAPKAGAKKK